jgi:antitoxin (DNA-binding transcriptional repressor) of toxin-antitoxin stability system
MKKATVATGEDVVITERGRALITLTPTGTLPALAPLNRIDRLEEAFPDGPVDGDSLDDVSYDRGGR